MKIPPNVRTIRNGFELYCDELGLDPHHIMCEKLGSCAMEHYVIFAPCVHGIWYIESLHRKAQELQSEDCKIYLALSAKVYKTRMDYVQRFSTAAEQFGVGVKHKVVDLVELQMLGKLNLDEFSQFLVEIMDPPAGTDFGLRIYITPQ